ncbi:MAG: Bax inhibitor-1/YccA family protein [Pseudomonadota bacterium]|nr:Bax inhibitor-1/YccA family protein [Pseudomonadota bacterium]
MNNINPDRFSGVNSGAVSYDAGLKSHMNRVYARMSLGVLISALVSFFVASSPELMKLFLSGPQAYVVMFAPVAIVFFGFNPAKMSSNGLRLSFIAVSALYGISFATIFYAYQLGDITRAFLLATIMLSGLSIFGYTTKRDLGPLGTFCIMGVLGVFAMGILNMFFFKNAGFADIISIVSILAFSGITAWETQNMKRTYNAGHGDEINSRLAWAGALSLYISFIAIFMNLLQLMRGGD